MGVMATVNKIYLCLCVCLYISIRPCERVSMKIVDEPSTYGLNNPYQGQNNLMNQNNGLKLRISPANFSGPPHLRQLHGHCYSKVDDQYKYEFCPFSNVTQHEQSLRWNPYSGVLGVWQEWKIENNTFVAMVMKEGDGCGSIQRTSTIFFKCGEKEELQSVSEPQTCQYHMIFKTALVCHPHAMLVYPTLSPHLQEEWDKLEGQLQQDIVTKKGYKRRLGQIFEAAGYYLSETQHAELLEKNQVKEETKTYPGTFYSLAMCTEEYQKLRKEIEGLQTLLAINQMQGGTVKSSTDKSIHKTAGAT